MSLIHHSQLGILATVAAVAVAGLGPQLAAQSQSVRFEVMNPVEVRLAGSSTLHSWDCVGDRLDLSTSMDLARNEFHAAVDAAWDQQLPLPIDFNGQEVINGAPQLNGAPIVIKVPIESLECGRSRMKRDLRDTVKYEQYPVIEYELEAIRGTTLSEEDPDTLKMEVTGKLTVAGVSRSVEHHVEITRLGKDSFEVRGDLDLKMDWFDMEPPSAFFGMLKAHNAFQVEFLFQARVYNFETAARD